MALILQNVRKERETEKGNGMFTRRTFLTASAAFGATAATSAMAQDAYVDPQFMPQVVSIQSGFEPNTIHVDPNAFALYLILGNDEAIRYSVGVARQGLYEDGVFTVGNKREWPSWTPTPGMISREPEIYAKYAGGMPGGPDNPLGSRALYLYDANGRDTYLRIHGTPDPVTIGTSVSNGCVRLMNDHVADLYDRVAMGTPVYLYPREMA